MSAGDDLAATLIALERWLATASADDAAPAIAPDFLEHGASGRTYDRAAALAALARPRSPVEASDFAVRSISPTVALVTYRTPGSLRASLWRLDNATWRIVFHAGTPMS